MKLYHGSNVIVAEPRILPPRPGHTLDFGTGFYATTSIEQARRWVGLRQKRGEVKDGYVSCYEVDDDILAFPGLKCLRFQTATVDWLHFVMGNRDALIPDHGYDIVAGPVANDRVYATLTLFEIGQLDAEETVRRLKTYTLVDQLLFHTEKALAHLRFTGSEVVNVRQ